MAIMISSPRGVPVDSPSSAPGLAGRGSPVAGDGIGHAGSGPFPATPHPVSSVSRPASRVPHPATGGSGFTLIELLVVIAIIALLVSITVPVLSQARRKANSTHCLSNLHGLGQAMLMYLGDSKDIMPQAAQMPSLALNALPPIADVLEPYLDTRKALLCPADSDQKWFIAEGSSYEYNSGLGGRKVEDNFLTHHFGISKTFVMFDYESFHGPSGTKGSRNYLFADGHVGDLVD
jgi:prepilin-type N-terminal cleavage/methylation domain-containing protein/prepilin-type processing-associated H-X9-DG protein